jgi:sterol-4alpha-carboxylate 3-dehydrogenase (decarboxylating)
MGSELGSVLIVGGCGFLGHHIVSRLVDSHPLEISVLDLDTKRNRFPRVAYHDIDITSRPAVQSILQQIKPQTIIHTASPNVLLEGPSLAQRRALYEKVNIEGTRNLVDSAGELGFTNAFVYTSSASVVHDSINDLFNATERLPVLQYPQQTEIYSHTKGVAEHIALAANLKYGVMRTTAIRPVSMFGEADAGWLPNLLDVYDKGKTNIQLGDNTALVDLLYVGNSADAHILASKALYRMNARTSDDKRVDGQAFFVTNDEPYRFWDFARAVWAAAGDRSDVKNVWVIPKNVGLIMATLAEWIFWLFFWGTKEPKLTRRRIKHTCMNRTFFIDKAKSRLGYRPRVSVAEGIERGVKWFQERGHKEKKTQ